MFHVNAWSFPFGSVMNGCNVIFLGRDLTPQHITKWLLNGNVTFAAAVPTLWVGVHLELKKLNAPKLPHLRIICGGSAVPASLIEGTPLNTPLYTPYPFHSLTKISGFERDFGVIIRHAWVCIFRYQEMLLIKHTGNDRNTCTRCYL